MENKLTAIQTLAIIIEDRIGVSTMADQSKEAIVGYQMALVGIKIELKKLLELEKNQLKDTYLAGWDALANGKHQYSEDYYQETYGKE